VNKRLLLFSGWWVPGGQLPSHPGRWPFPNPRRHGSRRKGPLQPRGLSTQLFFFFFFFLDQVVQVRLQQDQLPRWSGVKVIINNARDEKVPWGGCGQTSKDLQNKSG
uniref:Uncharacterized protein n=1 Tax=Lynx canadensis TaxID=61383 RepID=A0A667GMW4_LYNCA